MERLEPSSSNSALQKLEQNANFRAKTRAKNKFRSQNSSENQVFEHFLETVAKNRRPKRTFAVFRGALQKLKQNANFRICCTIVHACTCSIFCTCFICRTCCIRCTCCASSTYSICCDALCAFCRCVQLAVHAVHVVNVVYCWMLSCLCCACCMNHTCCIYVRTCFACCACCKLLDMLCML